MIYLNIDIFRLDQSWRLPNELLINYHLKMVFVSYGSEWNQMKDVQYQYTLEESLPDSTLHCWFVSDNTRLDVFSTYIAEGLQFPFPHVLHRIVCSYSPKDTTRYIPL